MQQGLCETEGCLADQEVHCSLQHEGSLPSITATGLYHEPDETSPCPDILFLYPLSTILSQKRRLFLRFIWNISEENKENHEETH
jgi:hypothetical protein